MATKLIDYTTYSITISSHKGNYIQGIYVKANSMDEALAIGKQYAESVEGEISEVKKFYYKCIEQSTKTITINI